MPELDPTAELLWEGWVDKKVRILRLCFGECVFFPLRLSLPRVRRAAASPPPLRVSSQAFKTATKQSWKRRWLRLEVDACVRRRARAGVAPPALSAPGHFPPRGVLPKRVRGFAARARPPRHPPPSPARCRRLKLTWAVTKNGPVKNSFAIDPTLVFSTVSEDNGRPNEFKVQSRDQVRFCAPVFSARPRARAAARLRAVYAAPPLPPRRSSTRAPRRPRRGRRF